MAEFKDVIVYLRKRSNLSQEEAARGIGITRSALANYELGKRVPKDLAVLDSIADYYNVSMDVLLGKKEKPVENSYELSDSEGTLIKLFRGLPESDQKAVVSMIRSLLDSRGLL